MKKPLPPFGFADDFLESLPVQDPEDPQQISRFVEQVARADDEEEAAPEAVLQIMTFSLGGDLFAVPVENVREVIRVQALTRVPQAPPHFRGLHNLRGTILPVWELRTRLRLSPAVVGPATRIVVVEREGDRIGALVDEVHQVVRVPISSISAPPADVKSRLSGHIVGTAPMQDRLAFLLSLDLLTETEVSP